MVKIGRINKHLDKSQTCVILDNEEKITMDVRTKLAILINKAFPVESGIYLHVSPIITDDSYVIRIFKNGKGLEIFTVLVNAAKKLVE